MLLAATLLSCSAQDRDSPLMSHAGNRSKRVAPRKFHGTVLLKCLLASCLLDGIGAASVPYPLWPPCHPTSTTCACSPEIAEVKSLLLAVMAKQQASRP